MRVRLMEATFTAVGQITRPGKHPTDATIDLLTALSLAGGVLGPANDIEIIRKQGRDLQVIQIRLDRIRNREDPNLAIHPGDTLYVGSDLF